LDKETTTTTTTTIQTGFKSEEQKQEFQKQLDALREALREIKGLVETSVGLTPDEKDELSTEILHHVKINEKLLVSNREKAGTSAAGDVGSEATVEVAHEALFTCWERLKNWIAAAKRLIFVKNRLADDSGRWKRIYASDPKAAEDELWAGSRLDEALGLRVRNDFVTIVGGLSEDESRFLDLSAALRDKRRQEEEEQRQRELEAAQKLARTEAERANDQARAAARLRRLISTMVVLSLLALAAAVFAWAKQKEAAQQARIALSRELAASAVHSSDPELQVQLAYKAVAVTYSADSSVTAEAAESLRKSVPPEPMTLSVGHTEPISAIAFSPDGNRLATASERCVKIWDQASGNELLTLFNSPDSHGTYKKIVGLAWSGDGGNLVCAIEYEAKVWDSYSGRELFASQVEEGIISGITIDRDGRHLVISGKDNVRLYEILTRSQLWEGSNDQAAFQSNVAFSPDGKDLVTATNATVYVREASTGKELLTLPKQVSLVYSVAFSPDGKQLATISGERGETVRVWDLTSRRESMSLSAGIETVTDIAFSPDSNRLAIESAERRHASRHSFTYGSPTIRVLEVSSKGELFRFAPHIGVTSLTFCLDGTRLATVSGEEVHLWDAASGSEVRTLAGRNLVACSPDGKRLAAPGKGGQATVWEVNSGKELVALLGQTDITASVAAFSPDRKRLVTRSSDGRVRVWDVTSGRNLLTTHSDNEGFDVMAYSPDGKRLVTGRIVGGAIKVLEAASGSEVLTLEQNCAAFSPSGTQLVVGGFDESAKIWDETSGQVVRTFASRNVRGVAFSPDGKCVVTASDEIGKVWDVASGKELFGLFPPPKRIESRSWDIVFSPDGTKIATVRQVWDAGAGRQLFAIPETGSKVSGLVPMAFSPDSTRLATGVGKLAKIWDIASRKDGSEKEPLTLDNSAEVRSLAFTLEGTYLVAVCDDWTVRFHPLRIEDLMALAHKRVPRELSAEERQKYLHAK